MIQPKSAFHIGNITDNGNTIEGYLYCDPAVADAIIDLEYVISVEPWSPTGRYRIIFNPRNTIEEIRIEFPKDVAVIATAARLLGDE